MNQSLNLNLLKYQSVLNRDNLYRDPNMNEVRTTTVQHLNDLALPEDVTLWESDKLTFVHMPHPVRTPNWPGTVNSGQTVTPRRR